MNQFPGTNFHDLNLDWLLDEMKNCLSEWADVRSDWESTEQAWSDLHDYVQNYFSTLDVTEEVNARVEAVMAQMYSNGQLLTLISPTVETAAANGAAVWIAENLSQETGYVIDASLTVSGAAADAKAIGDAVTVTQEGLKNASGKLIGNAILSFRSGGIYLTSDDPELNGVWTPNDAYCGIKLTCSPGDKFTINVGGTTGGYRAYAFYDSDNVLISRAASGVHTKTITAPENCAYVVINNRLPILASGYYAYVGDGSIADDVDALQDAVASIDSTSDYHGCKLSLLGDSASAYEGYSTDGHKYYPNVNSDVDSVNQMWWKIVADHFGMTPLVIGAWSGSSVTEGARAGWTGTVGSDPARCEALDDGTSDPDVILIAMGGNDYTYMADASQFGTWDGTTALGSESDLSDYNNTTFRTAYATMLARIQYKYPNAFIICITPFFNKRRTTDTGANYLNAIGKSLTDYADAIREVCNIMHVVCVDGTNIGFNRRNFYPTYCQDTATQSTHPNIAGQAQIAKAIIAQIRNIHRLGA